MWKWLKNQISKSFFKEELGWVLKIDLAVKHLETLTRRDSARLANLLEVTRIQRDELEKFTARFEDIGKIMIELREENKVLSENLTETFRMTTVASTIVMKHVAEIKELKNGIKENQETKQEETLPG